MLGAMPVLECRPSGYESSVIWRRQRARKMARGRSTPTNLERAGPTWADVARVLAWAFSAFLLSRASIQDQLFPMGPAFLAAAIAFNPSRAGPILLGSLAGTISAAQGPQLWPRLVNLVLLAVMLRRANLPFDRRWLMVPGLVVISTLITQGVGELAIHMFQARSIAPLPLGAEGQGVLTSGLNSGVGALRGIDLAWLGKVVLEAGLAGGLAVAFLAATEAIYRLKDQRLAGEEVVALLILALGMVSGLGGWEWGGISALGVAGRLLILLAAAAGGSGAGAGVGAAVGLIPSLSSLILSPAIGYYALIGLLAGALRRYGKWGLALAFLIGTLTLSPYAADRVTLLGFLGETVLAVALFLALPGRLLAGLGWRSSAGLPAANKKASSEGKKWRWIVGQRLRRSARAMDELRRTFQDAVVTGAEEDKLTQGVERLEREICRPCTLYRLCWEKNYYDTYRAFLGLLAAARMGPVEEKHLDKDTARRCSRTRELLWLAEWWRESWQQQRWWRQKVNEGRRILAYQAGGMASFLEQAATQVQSEVEFDADWEQGISAQLKERRLPVSEVKVLKEPLEIIVGLEVPGPVRAAPGLNDTEGGQEGAAGRLCGQSRLCLSQIVPLVGKLVGKPMTLDNRACGPSTCNFSIVAAPPLKVRVGGAQACQEGKQICGDNWASFPLGSGRWALVVSDGMGSGSEAAQQSAKTIGLIREFLEAGLPAETAVRLANGSMLLTSQEDSFATIDLVILNLHSGEGEFIKVGALPSLVKRGRRVAMVRSPSLPAGILDQIEIHPVRYRLRSGDILCLFSDGVLDAARHNHSDRANKVANGSPAAGSLAVGPPATGPSATSPRVASLSATMEADWGNGEDKGGGGGEWLPTFFRDLPPADAQAMAQVILQEALNHARGVAYDDMTVVVALLE